MQITVADVQKIVVKDGEMLVVFVNVDNMPRTQAEKIMQDSARFMRQAIPNQAVQIIVVPQNKYSFGIIDPTQATQLGINGPTTGTAVGGTSVDVGDPFDRAMKGLI